MAADKSLTKIRAEKSSGSYVDTQIVWSNGYPTKYIYPEGNGVQLRYDADTQLTASIRCNASGIRSTGSPSSLRSSSDHLVTEYAYTTSTNWQLVTDIIDPVGSHWALDRDSLGNVTYFKTPKHASDPYVMAYDSKSRVETIDDPEGRRVSLVYSTTGTLSQVIVDPTGGSALALTTTLYRDGFENVTRVKDPENRETTYARNKLGFVTEVTSPSSGETDYLYDLNDVVTEVRTDIGISYLNAERVVKYVRNIMDPRSLVFAPRNPLIG